MTRSTLHCPFLNGVLPAMLFAGAAVFPAKQADAQWVVTSLHPPGAYASRAYTVYEGKQAGDISSGPADSTLRATLWSGTAESAVSFHPAVAESSRMTGSINGQQVGLSQTGSIRAYLWTGSAASVQSLHPDGYATSVALCTDGVQQGGAVTGQNGQATAAYWTGTAGSCITLAPPGSTYSAVNGVHSGQQGGTVQFGSYPEYTTHAVVWSGSSGSMVNLTPGSDLGFSYGSVYNVHAGRQCGIALTPSGNSAALWSGSPGSLVALNPTGANRSAARGLYNQHVCGDATFTIGGFQRTRAAYWNGTAGSYEDLHAALGAEFTTSVAYGVYEDSSGLHVVGFASGPGLPNRAILWSIPTNPPPCGPADVGKVGGLAGADGLLDNNDFIVFIDQFFEGC